MCDLLIKITEDEIADIIASHYRVPASDVCLYHDYEFVRRGNDKKRRDFIYGIVDFRNQKEEEDIDER